MKTESGLSDLLFPNQYRRRVLGLLLMRPEQQIHLRELARVIGAAPGTLKKELDALCDAGLLRAERVGNQVRFCANTAHPVFPELQALIRKTIGLADALRLSLAPLVDRIDAAFIFGSMASGTERAGSDIDLMVVGDAGFAEIVDATYEAQAALGREINPKVMSASEWQAKRSERNAFLQDVLNKPRIMLIGDADAL
ncbi:MULTISPECIES: nucleotidyltransferase domain-containing protein [unclassified Thauera]|uniref:nucleotidyltransferase domain-containing protein n=1 Tax=unclassified Thauera TaxID=2609274 RepID=UPI000560C067|nr:MULTISPECIES: nucleotidyltransferase domain-containing protein [unclassified Thauera]WBL64681.1 nucleotidyltransferase domain-containing protein [Thauera sp. WB-2]